MQKQVCYFEDSPAAALAAKLDDSYLRLPVRRGERTPGMGQVATVWLADAECDAKELEALAQHDSRLRIVYLVKAKTLKAGLPVHGVSAYLPKTAAPAMVAQALASAFENLELAERSRRAEEQLQQSSREIDELNRIGVALSSERDTEALLNLILLKSREITNSDAGSLYLVEEVSETDKRLRFKLTQTDSIPLSFTEFTMPIDSRSIAGYVALTGEALPIEDVYELPSDAPYGFNRRYDEESGYRTKSMLTIPMKNQQGEVLGILQLINCKRHWAARLSTLAVVEQEVIPYSGRQQELANSLASQAAVAYENNVLYENIQTLFEDFVKAAVYAIEQRDPTTSGHSFRVSQLSCGLAEAADKASRGYYAALHFSREQMKEIRYAALLHDFGKVGVREEVLVKARKLYPLQLEIIRQRFEFIRKALEADYTRRKLEALQRGQPTELLHTLDQEYHLRLAEIDDYFQFILQVNEPTVLPGGQFDKLLEIAKRTYLDCQAKERNYLTPEEVSFLSIPQGSLDPKERLEIESHVVHTFNFLAQIPWTREIHGIPMIARAHHELLDGSGYPYKLYAPQIPLQSRMITVADIFDGLSAADRPYKKAVPTEKALDILGEMVARGQVDSALYQLFVEAKVYRLTARAG